MANTILRGMAVADEPEPDTRNAIERAAAVLELFAASQSALLGVSEIARALDLPKAVVHRTLGSLRAGGLIEVDEPSRRYRLGPAVLRLAAAYSRHLDIRDLARASMEQLCRATQETVTLSIRSGWTRVYVHQVQPPTDVKMVVELGYSYPLHAGSSSKAFLAFLAPEEIDRYLEQPLGAMTDRTIVDPARLRQELRDIRASGYARSYGERQPDAASIAAPILDGEGRPVAVISVCGPLERFGTKAEGAAQELLPLVRALSIRTGHRIAT